MNEESIKGQTALITGASSGIGKAVAEQFARRGAHVVITARRLDRLEAFAEGLRQKYKVKAFPLQLDVKESLQVDQVVKEIPIEIDFLVNNAGLALTSDKIQDGLCENWDTMIDTNVKGLLYMTRAILPSMVARNRGHIVNLGSIAGHECYVGGNVYSATKHAVRAISKSLRQDLLGTKIRVSNIDPGAVETEFSNIRFNDADRAKQVYQGFEPLVADDIADTILFCVTRPQHVNIAEIVVFPQAQAGITIYREGQPVVSPFPAKK